MSEFADRLSFLSSTVYWTASIRTLESSREDCLFTDPWAEMLAGETGQNWIAQRSPTNVLPTALPEFPQNWYITARFVKSQAA